MAAELWALDIAGLTILVVDDNSPDGTGEVADDLAQRRQGAIHTIHRSAKSGLGTAYIAGFTWAVDAGADLVIQMDADFSHSPSYIPVMLEKIKGCDLVIGSRYVREGKLDERWGIGP